MKRLIAAVLLLAVAGCISYAKVEKGDCRAVARGYWFSFNTPAIIEECRPDEDR